MRYVNVPPEDNLPEIVREWWMKGGFEASIDVGGPVDDDHGDRGPWRLSNAYWALRCRRRLIYHDQGTEKRPPAFENGTMWEMGHAIERIWLHMLSIAQPERLQLRQVPVRWEGPTIAVDGHIDLVTTFEGMPIVVDCKLMGSWKARRANPRSQDFGGLETEEAQVNAYAYLYGAPFAGLWVGDRDKGRPFYVVWETDPTLAHQVFDGFEKAARDLSATGILPERGPQPNGNKLPWECGYCPYVLSCYPTAREAGGYNKLVVT